MDNLILWLEEESNKCMDVCEAKRLEELQTCADILKEFLDIKK